MENIHPIEQIFLHKGLISVHGNFEIKDKTSLSMVYTPGVGECCMQIKANPNRLYDLSSAESFMFVLSNGSEFDSCFLERTPDFMLPLLELQCFAFKALANLNAVPLVFDSNIIKTKEDLLWLLVHIAPCVGGLELFEVSDTYWKGIEADLDKVEAVIVLTSTRTRILKAMSTLENNNYFVSLIIGMLVKIFSRLKRFGTIKEDFLDKLISGIYEDFQIKSLDEFSLKWKIISKILAILKIENQKLDSIIFQESFTDFFSSQTESKIFYHKYKETNSRLNSIFIHEAFKGMIKTSLILTVTNLEAFLSASNLKIVNQLCRKIFNDPSFARQLSIKRNYCAIVTDGTRILGFGDIGPRAGLPVMEGKICLFQQLGGINMIPLCLKSQKPEQTVRLVKSLSCSFNAINLEDISTPNCFIIEDSLKKELPIPVFHDDQHGTAIVVLAALINALKVVGKEKSEVDIVVNGAGAAGIAIVNLLLFHGFQKITVIDTKGAIFEGRPDLKDNPFKALLAKQTNLERKRGELSEIIRHKDVFIGVSAAKVLSKEMVRAMNKNQIVFALANPDPEIEPEEAKEAGARIVATGRSDFENQINNSLAFPGIFRGIIDGNVKEITLELKSLAAIALSNCIKEELISEANLLPYTLDLDAAQVVAESIAKNLIIKQAMNN